jgi:hypothetical protein
MNSQILHRSNDCLKCGAGHSNQCYVVYNTHIKCFSCGYYEPTGEKYAYRPQSIQHVKVETTPPYTPENTTNIREFAPEVLAWLYKYYVYQDLIEVYKIAYVPANDYKEHSLLLPITDEDGNVIEYQRRFFPTKTFYSTAGVKQSIFIARNNYSDGVVCLVEDYISAIRVGNTIDCMCLFGTDITEDKLKYLLKNYRTVLIWMDSDEPGVKAANKISQKIQNFIIKYPFLFTLGFKFDIINVPKQPKECTDSEIYSITNS